MITSQSSTAESILPRVAAGERGAMNRCIERYGALVWTIVRRHLGDSPDAEDLVQEVFTEIWKKSSAFDPALAGESTFVGMIARRRAIDQLRRSSRQPDFESLEAAESVSSDPPAAAAIRHDAERVRSSVAELPEETRTLFRLFFDDGCTHPEIADRTGLPLGTVKTRLRRGLLAVRERLQRAGNSAIQPSS